MTERALQLLALPEGESAYVLDIGCGSGLSGELLEEDGHVWVGVDVAPSMLGMSPHFFQDAANCQRWLLNVKWKVIYSCMILDRALDSDRELSMAPSGELHCQLRGRKLTSSISVLQWLCNADSTAHSPVQRLTRFFTTLHQSLKNPSRAVFQFYPSSDDQVTMITSAAQKAGFGGGLVVDYPNSTKKRKMYLCLMVGQQEIPKGIDGEEATLSEKRRKGEEVKNEKSRRKVGGKKGKKDKLDGKEWILKKKELYRTRGKEGYVLTLRRSDMGVHADDLVFPGIPSSQLGREECNSSLSLGLELLYVFTIIMLVRMGFPGVSASQ
jgi:18S rRNA (guanine1575-N7)-methyltransferase